MIRCKLDQLFEKLTELLHRGCVFMGQKQELANAFASMSCRSSQRDYSDGHIANQLRAGEAAQPGLKYGRAYGSKARQG